MKYIICDAASANWGKTHTLVEVARLFKSTPSLYRVLSSSLLGKDEWLVVRVNATGRIILVQTQGDFVSSYSATENYLRAGYQVDIIICACRPKGVTCQEVHRIARTYGFEEIKFANFCPLNRTHFSIPVISNVNVVNLAPMIVNFAVAL